MYTVVILYFADIHGFYRQIKFELKKFILYKRRRKRKKSNASRRVCVFLHKIYFKNARYMKHILSEWEWQSKLNIKFKGPRHQEMKRKDFFYMTQFLIGPGGFIHRILFLNGNLEKRNYFTFLECCNVISNIYCHHIYRGKMGHIRVVVFSCFISMSDHQLKWIPGWMKRNPNNVYIGQSILISPQTRKSQTNHQSSDLA